MLFPYTLRRDTHRGHIVWFAESCFLIGCYGIGVTTEEAIRDLEFKESRGLAYTKQLRWRSVVNVTCDDGLRQELLKIESQHRVNSRH